jgi:hypothetical protein
MKPQEFTKSELIYAMVQINNSKNFNNQCVENIMKAAGYYYQILLDENSCPVVFNSNLLPIPKSEFKIWCHKYAEIIVKRNGDLKKYEQTAGLFYVLFQDMTENEWQRIRSDTGGNLTNYNREKRDLGTSNICIPKDLKLIIDKYRDDWTNQQAELHSNLNQLSHSSSGCFGVIIAIIAITSISSMIIFHVSR